MTKRSLVVFKIVWLVLMLALVEGGAAVTTSYLTRRSMMASIPSLSDERIAYYVSHHHPTLGWGPSLDSSGGVVRLEPRADPAFAGRGWSFQPESGDERVMNAAVGDPAGDTPCVSTYGDSFTAGSEVGDDATYPHFLGVQAGCRVANYGVPGYGTDQAFMLFHAQRGRDQAPVAILGHISEDLLRNVNQYRNLLDPGKDSELVFKPAFTLNDGHLQLNPIPVQSEADFRAFERAPVRFLEHDAFRNRPRREFPYTVALLRWALTDFHVRAQMAGTPRFAAFYERDHRSEALAVTAAIMRAFSTEAQESGRQGIVLLIPAGRDLLNYRRTGKWIDQGLADELVGEGVRVIHAGPLMVARLGPNEDPCGLFRNCFQHFNARGYAMLASIVNEEISSRREQHAGRAEQ